jgi:phosphatidylglycerol:prolipoprotein diacylglycerol transferase
VLLGLTAAQLESFSLFVAGAIWLAILWRRHGGWLREDAIGAGARARPELRPV